MLARTLVLLLILAATVASAADRGTAVFPARKRALVVGVERPAGMSALKYADDDAARFAGALRSDLGFAPEEIRLLTTSGGPAPTRANVLAALDALLADPALGRGELFVLYFSGHGIGGPEGDFLVPADGSEATLAASCLRVNDVIARITARGLKNVLVVADACRSGRENRFGTELLAQARVANIALLLGCAPGSRSYEYDALGLGVFTHFLVRALADDRNLDEIGALWTSRLAAKIGPQVQGYTEADFGDDAQRPGGWANPARDVMLRVTPPPLPPDALARLAANPRGLTPEMYGASMSEYADALFDEERYTETIRLGKTLDAAGIADERALMLLAASLIWVGRDGEAAPIQARLARSEDPMVADWAVLASLSGTFPARERVAAALRTWRRGEDETSALLAWAFLRDVASRAELADFVREALAKLPPGTRTVAFLQGDAALGANDLPGAADRLFEALDRPEREQIADHVLVSLLGGILARLGDRPRLEGLTARMERAEGGGGSLARLSASWKAIGERDRAIALARAALSRGGLDESEAESVFVAAGHRVGEIADGLESLGKSRPYDWRTRLYALLARSAVTGVAVSPEAIQNEVEVYAENDLLVMVALFGAAESVLFDGIQAGVRGPEEANAMAMGFLTGLRAEIGRFERDGALWEMLVRYALLSEDSRGAGLLFARHVGPSRPTDDSALGAARLTLALAEGDWPTAARAWRDAALVEPERSNSGWPYAMALYAHGDVAGARALAATLGATAPNLAHMERATRLALAGDRKALLAYRPQDEADAAIVGLALLRGGDRSRSRELFEPSLRARTWLTLPVSAAAIAVLGDEARLRGDRAELARLAHSCSVSLVGAGAFDGISALVRPALAGYAARHAGASALVMMVAAEDDEEEVVPGTIEAEFKADGAFALRFRDREDSGFTATGRFDANGNLRGEATLNGEAWTVRAKLVPPALRRLVPAAKGFGQILSLCGPEGQWAIVNLPDLPPAIKAPSKPPSKKPPVKRPGHRNPLSLESGLL